jgi:hypothetical protein
MYIDNFRTYAVLGAVTPKHVTPRTHAVGTTSGRVLCGKVKPEHLADSCATDPAVLPTCLACLTQLRGLYAIGGSKVRP